MNRSHFSLWNPALGAWVAVPETSRARRKTGAARRGVTIALVFGALAAWSGTADADTFTVTSASDDATGAVAGTLSWAITQANATAGSTIVIDGAISTITAAGALPALTQPTGLSTTGDVRLAGSVLSGSGWTLLQDARLTASNGASGAPYTWWGVSSDAAVGGTVIAGAGHVTENGGTLVGGTGGRGGNNVNFFAQGSPGGMGGAGGNAVAGTGYTLTNTGSLVGGAGGAGGTGSNGVTDPGGGGPGGAGGAAVSGADFTVINSGTIEGGVGGAGGSGGTAPRPGPLGGAGAGGVGVAGSNVTIVNSGTIRGGLSGAAPGLEVRADAIRLGGTANSLELRAGSDILGNVVGSLDSGAVNALVLGGAGDASLDVSLIGTQYQNFNTFGKSGGGTWTLSGTSAAVMPWTVSGGTLSIGTDAALGNVAGALALEGGALRTTADIATARNISLGGAGGAIDTLAGTTLESTGVISGSGSLTKTGDGTLTLAGANTYGGGTVLEAGRLVAGSSSAFGTGSLSVRGGTLDLGAWDLRVASIEGQGGVVLNGQKLTVDQAGATRYDGELSGTGSLEKTGAGTLALAGASTFSGGTRLLEGRIDVGSSSALGTGALDMADGTTLGFMAAGLNLANALVLSGVGDPIIDTGTFDATLSGAISGTGLLTKEGTGTLTLSGTSTYTGATTVAAGTLAAGAANAFSPASAVTVAGGATLDLAGHSQSVAGMSLAGTVNLAGAAPGAVLTVTGPWTGQGGVLKVGTQLGSDGSPTDKVLLSGATAVASGTTAVQITNIGGLGGMTTGKGIEIIGTQNGASIADNAFSLAGPVSAGAYDYHLDIGTAGAYLSSAVPAPAAEPTPEPGSAPTPAAPATAVPIPTYRAEVPLYAALPEQFREAGLSMAGNLHQRVGDEVAGPRSRQAWGRIISMDRDMAQSGTVDARSQGRLNGFQAGTDLWANGQWRAGVYAGQLEGDMDVDGFARGVRNLAVGSNDLRGQFLGGYATWTGASGLYLDGVLQGGRLRYDVNPSGGTTSSGKGSSALASLEAGLPLAVAPGWTVEPQLQLVRQSISLDDVSIGGAQVRQDADGSWLARVGVRVAGRIGRAQPYARLNVYRSTGGTDVATFIGPAAATGIASATGGTRTELGAGATWQLSPAVGLYGEVGQLWGSGGSQVDTDGGVGGSLGVKVRW